MKRAASRRGRRHRVQWWTIHYRHPLWKNHDRPVRVWYEPQIPLLLKYYRKTVDKGAWVSGPHVVEW